MAALTLASAVALASSIALGGCFGIYIPLSRDACETAAMELRACLGVEPAKDPASEQCSNENLCIATCINAASCDELKASFGTMASRPSNPFTDCTVTCLSGEPAPPSPPPSGDESRPGALGAERRAAAFM